MHPEDVKAALRKKYGSLKAFELAHKLSKGAVCDVVRGGKGRLQTAKVIARELGVSVIDVSPACKRAYDRLQSDYISIKTDSHRLNSESV
jgi:lambda repressor-like predicted transcriptional regulator